MLTTLIGLDAKLRQYEQGERFIAQVEAEGGPELLARAWSGPEQLPTMAEIRAPELWVARVGGDGPPAALGGDGAAAGAPSRRAV